MILHFREQGVDLNFLLDCRYSTYGKNDLLLLLLLLLKNNTACLTLGTSDRKGGAEDSLLDENT